jgi:hypothetical protein
MQDPREVKKQFLSVNIILTQITAKVILIHGALTFFFSKTIPVALINVISLPLINLVRQSLKDGGKTMQNSEGRH